MLTTDLPNVASPIHEQLIRLTSLCDPTIPPTIDREALRARTAVISPDAAREFCDFLDRQFPTESRTLMVGMVHPKFSGEAINYLSGRPLNDDKLWIVGMSCTVAAMAAYRGNLPLLERGEIDRETFREIVGASWTYNSAKAFEIARAKREGEVATELAPTYSDLGKGFDKFLIETIKGTPSADAESFAHDVAAKIRRETGTATAILENPGTDGNTAELLKRAGCSKTAVAWVQGFLAEHPEIAPSSLSAHIEKTVGTLSEALRGSIPAFELSRAYSRAAYLEVAERLEAQGVTVDHRQLHILANARANTGHGSLGKFLLMFAENRALTAPEFSMVSQHLWSDMTATDINSGESRLVTPLGKMDLQGFRGDLPGIRGYPFMLTEGVAVTRDPATGNLAAKDVKDFRDPPPGTLAASNYFALQNILGSACAHVHAAVLNPGIRSTQESAEYMERMLNEPGSGLRLRDI